VTLARDPAPIRDPARGARRPAHDEPAVATTLCVLVRLDRLLVAIPAEMVQRLVLAAEVVVVGSTGGEAEGGPMAASGELRVRSGATYLPAWELGRLLGIEVATEAWIFLAAMSGEPDADGAGHRTPRAAGGAGLIALGTGPCLAVRRMPAPAPLPPGLFRAGGPAMIGTFAVDEGLRQRGLGVAGLMLDPVALVGAATVAAAVRRCAATAPEEAER